MLSNGKNNFASRNFLLYLTFKSDIVGLQNEDGSFSGDMWGEVDTRYVIRITSLFPLHDNLSWNSHLFGWKIIN